MGWAADQEYETLPHKLRGKFVKAWALKGDFDFVNSFKAQEMTRTKDPLSSFRAD